MLGEEQNENVYSSFEIDESSIIGNAQVMYWMIGLIQRNWKESYIFCVINNSTKANLFQYVIYNVVNANQENIDNNEDENFKTLIY